MFDLSAIKKRYFDIKLTVTDDAGKANEIKLEVEPPKLKTLKKLIAVSKSANEDSMDELAGAIQQLLSKNKSGFVVPMDYIEELDLDQMEMILSAYIEWVSEIKSDPN